MTVTLTERFPSDWMAGITFGVRFATYLEEAPVYNEPLPQKAPSRAPLWVGVVWPVREEDMTCRITEISFPEEAAADEFVPRTPLGRKLLALRNQAIQKGLNLLAENEVLEEVRRRRGEIDGHEADIY